MLVGQVYHTGAYLQQAIGRGIIFLQWLPMRQEQEQPMLQRQRMGSLSLMGISGSGKGQQDSACCMRDSQSICQDPGRLICNWLGQQP